MIVLLRRLLKLSLVIVLIGAGVGTVAASGQALLNAIVDGQVRRVAILLDQGVSPEAATRGGESEGKTALMWAAETGQVSVIRLLLQYGAQVDRSNPKGGTALMYAAVGGHVDAIRTLVEAGADPDHRVRHGWSPLLLATAKGHVDSVRALVELGADPKRRDVYGWTLLMHAADRGDRAMAEALLELGLDPQATDAAGVTATVLARRGHHAELVRLLER